MSAPPTRAETPTPGAVQIHGDASGARGGILTPDALAFVAELTRRFRPRLSELLVRRVERQARFDAGELPDFLAETAAVRAGDWTVATLPPDLLDRRVEITGPVDRKMIINALNSGANAFMADFEDSNAPTWGNCIDGQVNLRDAIRRTIDFTHPTTGKSYQLCDEPAVLLVRPRGLHLVEAHAVVDGAPVPASLFDFGLYFFHNARPLIEGGSGPYFYLPKLESHLEARWWNDVFLAAQGALGIPTGTIKATVLIETLPGAFEMEEILHELRQHSSGLNCGRWDYIFSYIKTVRAHADRVLPDRSQVGMGQHFMRSYAQKVIQVCHRRGVHAMGGMAAQIPIKNDPAANEAALAKVRADKEREATDGHDGTWVAHPGLVAIARDIFDTHMPTPNQVHRQRPDVDVSAEDLLRAPEGTRTEAGLRQNINVGVLYMEAWLRGNGCVPLYHLMEDAATAEISRSQLWQWLRHGAELEDGRRVTPELFNHVLLGELERIRASLGPDQWAASRIPEAASLFEELSLADDLAPFLTIPAYERLIAAEADPSS